MSERRHAFIFVNGVLTLPGNSRAWTDRAVHAINRHPCGASAYAFEYYTSALFRRLRQHTLAADLAETLAEYSGAELHLVGHSNGCDLIARACRISGLRIASLHLIAAALDSDFARNGLGELLLSGRLGRVYCSCSRGDHVLKYAARASQIATLGLLGYGRLGYEGPQLDALPALLGRVGTIWRDDLGHGDWFSPVEFPTTLERTVRDALSP